MQLLSSNLPVQRLQTANLCEHVPLSVKCFVLNRSDLDRWVKWHWSRWENCNIKRHERWKLNKLLMSNKEICQKNKFQHSLRKWSFCSWVSLLCQFSQSAYCCSSKLQSCSSLYSKQTITAAAGNTWHTLLAKTYNTQEQMSAAELSLPRSNWKQNKEFAGSGLGLDQSNKQAH